MEICEEPECIIQIYERQWICKSTAVSEECGHTDSVICHAELAAGVSVQDGDAGSLRQERWKIDVGRMCTALYEVSRKQWHGVALRGWCQHCQQNRMDKKGGRKAASRLIRKQTQFDSISAYFG